LLLVIAVKPSVFVQVPLLFKNVIQENITDYIRDNDGWVIGETMETPTIEHELVALEVGDTDPLVAEDLNVLGAIDGECFVVCHDVFLLRQEIIKKLLNDTLLPLA
jgi:hypothetical protein